MTQVLERVKKVVGDTLGVLPSELQDTANLCNDLEADSFRRNDVLMGLEEEFDIDFSDPEFCHCSYTIATLTALVQRKLAAKLPVAALVTPQTEGDAATAAWL